MTAPAYDEIATHEDLVGWSRDYCKDVRREWLVDVRFDLVEWEVSTRAKRRAAALKRPKIPEAEVGTPIDWESTTAAGGRRADGRPFPATLSLTWDAFDAFDREQWESTLRHELVHLEQYQHCGTTDHGSAFKARARELDTEVHCETFSDPKYVLRCAECDALVARRYKDCKLVRRAEEYRSSCCQAALAVE
ncbi:SprT-like domain-containing protein [Halosimplex amylolyticum]|uniref:SprT-like domain-containing protein n=1 Tax=Halosimplex amylolyticum TaxID=3396616 RepID=UPI003F571CF5